MKRRLPDALTWALAPLIVAMGLLLGLLHILASLLRVAALGLEWLGDAAAGLVADDRE